MRSRTKAANLPPHAEAPTVHASSHAHPQPQPQPPPQEKALSSPLDASENQPPKRFMTG